MIVLGLDIATTTGWALYDSHAPMANIKTGIWHIKGQSPEAAAKDIGRKLQAALLDAELARGAHLVMIEEPLRVVTAFQNYKINPKTPIKLNALVGAAFATCSLLGYEVRTVPVASWRKYFLGFARQAGFKTEDYKKACVKRCQMLGINVARHDAADAVGVAFYGAGRW